MRFVHYLSCNSEVANKFNKMAQYKFQTLFNQIDLTQTGGCAGVAGYKRLGFQLKAQNITSGSGVFKIQGTVTGSDWTYLAMIDQLATTNSQTLTRVLSKTISANESVLMWVDEGLSLRAVRVHLTFATDGSYSCYLLASE